MRRQKDLPRFGPHTRTYWHPSPTHQPAMAGEEEEEEHEDGAMRCGAKTVAMAMMVMVVRGPEGVRLPHHTPGTRVAMGSGSCYAASDADRIGGNHVRKGIPLPQQQQQPHQLVFRVGKLGSGEVRGRAGRLGRRVGWVGE